jgi:small conductance mechanosensitive channel
MQQWIERLLNSIYDDIGSRFDAAQFAKIIGHLLDTTLILIVALCALWIVRRMMRKINQRMLLLSKTAAQRRKVDTFDSLIYSTCKYAVYIAATLWILNVWGVDTTSLVVGSAVIGAAIGFGSQGLVQDIIMGLSILAEEQLSVGDYVEIAGKSGAVEEVGLRVIKLRDHLGVQHVIFNRTVSMVSNYTSGSIQAVIDVSLENKEASEAAKRIATHVCRDLAHELPYFTETPEVQGVLESSTHDVFLRINVRVLPQQQEVLQSLFVERLKCAFAGEKISIPDGRVRVVILSELFSRTMSKVEAGALPPNSEKIYEGSV